MSEEILEVVEEEAPKKRSKPAEPAEPEAVEPVKQAKPRRKYALSTKVSEEYKYTWADVFTGEPPLELPDEIVQMNVRKLVKLLTEIEEALGYPLMITRFLGGGSGDSDTDTDEMYARGMAVEFICPPYDPTKIFTRLSNHQGGLAVINGRVYLDIGDKRRWKFP